MKVLFELNVKGLFLYILVYGFKVNVNENESPNIQLQKQTVLKCTNEDEIRTYREFLKYTSTEHQLNDSIKVTYEVLCSLRQKIDEYRTTSNQLKAKIKYRDSQVYNIKQKLKSKLSEKNYKTIEQEINNIPGKIIIFLKVLFSIIYFF